MSKIEELGFDTRYKNEKKEDVMGYVNETYHDEINALIVKLCESEYWFNTDEEVAVITQRLGRLIEYVIVLSFIHAQDLIEKP